MGEQQESNDHHQPEGPTLDELLLGFREGGQEKLVQLMTINGRRMIPSPQDLALAWQQGGKELLGALMSHMHGLVEVDDPDPEWNERRWR
jgi:hypothetical protein